MIKMKNTKNRMEIFNDLSFTMFNDLNLTVRKIHLSETILCLIGSHYTTKKSNFRLYSIYIYENHFTIRCSKSWLSKSSKKYLLTKKF